MKKTLLLLSLFIYSVTYSQTIPSFITDSLDNHVNNALKNFNIPGVAVCIVKDGKVVAAKGYGVLELGKNEKVDANTLFLIGSNTKAFTGTALAILEHEKKLSLTDKVKKYYPDLDMKDDWVENELNLTDIVSHRMGLETFQGDFMYWGSDLTKKQVIEKFGKLTPVHPFRTKWGYTNAGFAIAGEVINSVTGKPWEDFIRTRFFTPLEMNNSKALSVEAFNSKNMAKPHTYIEGKLQVIDLPNIDNLAPAASIVSSVEDMSHWVMALLDSGKYNGKEAIPFRAIQKSRVPQSYIGGSSNPFERNPFNLYGLGWEIESYKNKSVVSHTGGVDGFVTSVTLVPSEKLGVVVLTNTDQNLFFLSLKWHLIDAYLNPEYKDYTNLFLSYNSKDIENNSNELAALRDSVKLNLKPSVDLDEFEGKYTHEIYGDIFIEKDGSNLKMTFENHKSMTAKLESLGNDKFLCTYSNPLLGVKVFPFIVEDGEVKSFELTVVDFLERTPYLFVKQ